MSQTTLDQIHDLEQRIHGLKQQAIDELRLKIAGVRGEIAQMEKDLAKLTGSPSTSSAPAVRVRRPSISDEELKVQILKAIAAGGQHGMNAKSIADAINQAPIRVRDFIKKNPKMLRRTGAGPGTRFFLP